MSKSVLVLGGDGYCGWPIALSLSEAGHDVTIIDNLSRRRIDDALGYRPLLPIASPGERCGIWKSVSDRTIGFHHIDIAQDYDRLRAVLADLQPSAIVHLAAQRSAPYSVSSPSARRYTVTNNLGVTHALLVALVDLGLDSHLIHLGSIGVLGYTTAGLELPEGKVAATIHGADGRCAEMNILYPGKPVSIYHMSKAMDQVLFEQYARDEGVRITDLNQGIVWGSSTMTTERHPELRTRLDVDSIYGTVVNRFLVQAATGQNISVYGTGGQTRGFIHLRDVIRCVELVLNSEARGSERFRLINQITETLSIRELAQKVGALTGAPIEYRENPRQEPEENEFHVAHMTLQDLGLRPTLFADQLAQEAETMRRACTASMAV
ncbi:NAD-dependent epimerase/dehydratase family protein [Sulfitobacter aestuarii]|uniref:NAD-dependent epimerase/dehydratase family protein n=1 Tax=Sulfitobacter aestuarii TaxID=2161676 RepID=A0ABW5U2W7_9RHOB